MKREENVTNLETSSGSLANPRTILKDKTRQNQLTNMTQNVKSKYLYRKVDIIFFQSYPKIISIFQENLSSRNYSIDYFYFSKRIFILLAFQKDILQHLWKIFLC